LKFLGELWAQQACAATNQQELTTCAKSGGQEKKKIAKKRGKPTLSRRQPAAGGRPQVDAWIGSALSLFLEFFFFPNFLLEVWGMGQGFWKNGCTIHPFFQASPYTWKCQIFHSS
jgi:hypothetical protein